MLPSPLRAGRGGLKDTIGCPSSQWYLCWTVPTLHPDRSNSSWQGLSVPPMVPTETMTCMTSKWHLQAKPDMHHLWVTTVSQLQVNKLLQPGLNLNPQREQKPCRRICKGGYSGSLPTTTIKMIEMSPTPWACVPHSPMATEPSAEDHAAEQSPGMC